MANPLQEFPQHLAPFLRQRLHEAVIEHGKAVVKKTIADQAAYDALLALVQADYRAYQKAQAKTGFDAMDLIKGLALTLLDELNNHAATTTAILDAIDGASNLAELKTSIAAISDPPQRTGAQLKTAVLSKIDTL